MSECKWYDDGSIDIFDSHDFETDCGDVFTFSNGGVEENNFKHCPFCGGTIVEKTDERQ